MRDLNGSIGDFAYQLLQVIPEALLTGKCLEGTWEPAEIVRVHAQDPVFHNPGTIIGDFIQPFVQYATCMLLLEVGFFHWVLERKRHPS